MSAGKVVGLFYGVFSLVQQGLVNCDGGFGIYGCTPEGSGELTYTPDNIDDHQSTVEDLATLLTAGRLGPDQVDTIVEQQFGTTVLAGCRV